MKINGIKTKIKNEYEIKSYKDTELDYIKRIPQSHRNNNNNNNNNNISDIPSNSLEPFFYKTKEIYSKPKPKKHRFKSVNNSFNLDEELDIELAAVSKIIPLDYSDVNIEHEHKKIKRNNSCETTKINHLDDVDYLFGKSMITSEKKIVFDNDDNVVEMLNNEINELKEKNMSLQIENKELKSKLECFNRNNAEKERCKMKEIDDYKHKIKQLENELKVKSDLIYKMNLKKRKIIFKVSKQMKFTIQAKVKVKVNRKEYSSVDNNNNNKSKNINKRNDVNGYEHNLYTNRKVSQPKNKKQIKYSIQKNNIVILANENNCNNNDISECGNYLNKDEVYFPRGNNNLYDEYELQTQHEILETPIPEILTKTKVHKNKIKSSLKDNTNNNINTLIYEDKLKFTCSNNNNNLFYEPDLKEFTETQKRFAKGKCDDNNDDDFFKEEQDELNEEISHINVLSPQKEQKRKEDKSSLIMSVLNDDFSNLLVNNFSNHNTYNNILYNNNGFNSNNNNYTIDNKSKPKRHNTSTEVINSDVSLNNVNNVNNNNNCNTNNINRKYMKYVKRK